MKNVYLNKVDNTISFKHIPEKAVCIGETDESLEKFLEWMSEDWKQRNVQGVLPTIEKEVE